MLKGYKYMLFEVGETVVYPHHGAATITEVKTRMAQAQRGGDQAEYFKWFDRYSRMVKEIAAL